VCANGLHGVAVDERRDDFTVRRLDADQGKQVLFVGFMAMWARYRK